MYAEEDDLRRPVAVLGYNTRQQVQQSTPLALDEQAAKWNYAFWLQSEELCFGLGDTAGELYITGIMTHRKKSDIVKIIMRYCTWKERKRKWR